MATSALAKPPAAAATFVSTLFTSALSALDIRMPLRHDTACCGTIIDAEGRMVFVIDTNREHPDREVTDIATLLVLALNVHAGYPPEASHG
ncbi:hypothetical protein RLPCCGM1_c1300 [Rhizobium leguminosarum bv. phaseoli CCGM1]|uniref:hypothetical protein n=1 Tax=Rhizobium phaseoli TaxID=396 RepID=UPI0004DAE016|nr:hypothetical protein [Rhizobium phaseoli]KEC73184.1 hypothetical protein RLPCCGM1_c1300 [Rhizobium leguminosarum bv. phaseoli CCGM1]PWI54152.1 hypothetical protein B5K03_11975 [Rhizobium phaseoli]